MFCAIVDMNDIRQVEIEGSLYRYVHNARAQIGTAVDAFQRTSWEEQRVLAGIRQFVQIHGGL